MGLFYSGSDSTGELLNRLASDTAVMQNAVTVNVSMACIRLLSYCAIPPAPPPLPVPLRAGEGDPMFTSSLKKGRHF